MEIGQTFALIFINLYGPFALLLSWLGYKDLVNNIKEFIGWCIILFIPGCVWVIVSITNYFN